MNANFRKGRKYVFEEPNVFCYRFCEAKELVYKGYNKIMRWYKFENDCGDEQVLFKSVAEDKDYYNYKEVTNEREQG